MSDTIQVRRVERCYDEDHGPNHCYNCGGSGWLPIGGVIELAEREGKERRKLLDPSITYTVRLLQASDG